MAPILAPIGGNVNFNIPENIKRGCRKTPQPLLIIMFFLVPGAGIEPARSQTSRDFKSLASTNSAIQAFAPYIKIRREIKLEAPPGFEPGMEVLQTSALPLGDGANIKKSAYGMLISHLNWSGKRDSNPRLQPWQGCTLPLSYSRP